MKTPTSALLAMGMVASVPCQALPEPRSHIGIAGIDFQSQIGVNEGHESNVTFQPHARDAIGSSFQHINTQFKALGERHADRYLLMYTGNYRRYGQDSHDNYADHFFRFNGMWHFGQMHDLELNVEDTLGHEQRGRGITEGFVPQQFRQFGIDEPLSTRFLSSELRYGYGAAEGRGRIETAVLYKQVRFGNTTKEKGTDTDFYNYIRDQEWHETSYIAELFDLYAKQTRFRYSFITNLRRYEINARKDTNEYYLLYGIRSQLTGKTHVDANVSWLHKSFIRNPDSKDFDGVNWNAEIVWEPVKQSALTLHTSQRIKDPSEIGGYIQVTEYGLAWTHHWWVDRFSTTVDYAYITEAHKKQQNNRRDKEGLLTLSMSYDFRPSVNFEVKYQIDTMRSNLKTDTFFIGPEYDREVDRTLGYDNQLIMLTARVQI